MTLTKNEHEAMDKTVDLVEHMVLHVIGSGDTRTADINEFVLHIHAIQRMIMAQSAARQYPDLYRRLGETVGE
jgi:hypothetical protein